MNYAKVQDTYKQLPVSSERAFPTAPFPYKYIHSVVDDLRSAVEAVQALRGAGYHPRDIHVMASWDFVEAVERRQHQQNYLLRVLMRLISFFDEGLGDVYLHQAQQGRHIIMVRLPSNQHIERIRTLLAAHHAKLIKYVDTWTVTDLIPPCSQDDSMPIDNTAR